MFEINRESIVDESCCDWSSSLIRVGMGSGLALGKVKTIFEISLMGQADKKKLFYRSNW